MSLLDLPNEMVLAIAGMLCDESDINRFSQTNLRLHWLVGDYLYENNIKEHEGWALYWAAFHGREKTAEKLFKTKKRIGLQNQSVIINNNFPDLGSVAEMLDNSGTTIRYMERLMPYGPTLLSLAAE